MPLDDNAEIAKRLRELLGRPDPVGFARKGIAPGAFSYVTRADRLYLRSRNSVSTTVVRISGRLHQPDGDIHEFTYLHTPATDRSASLEAFELGEGYISGLAVDIATGTVRRGQCWIELGLLRGVTAAASVRQVLGRDYVSTNDAWGWPGAPNKSSLHGPGAIRSITGTNPIAGAEIVETVPTNARWRLLATRFALVADANAADRGVLIELTDGTTAYHHTRQHDVQTASQTRTYNYAQGALFEAGVLFSEHHNVLPDALMGGGHVWQTVTGSIQVGDDYGAPQYLVEEWLEE